MIIYSKSPKRIGRIEIRNEKGNVKIKRIRI